MHAPTYIVRAILFSTSLARKNVTEHQHWGGNAHVYVGNKDCGKDEYHYYNSCCSGHAFVQLGNITSEEDCLDRNLNQYFVENQSWVIALFSLEIIFCVRKCPQTTFVEGVQCPQCGLDL